MGTLKRAISPRGSTTQVVADDRSEIVTGASPQDEAVSPPHDGEVVLAPEFSWAELTAGQPSPLGCLPALFVHELVERSAASRALRGGQDGRVGRIAERQDVIASLTLRVAQKLASYVLVEDGRRGAPDP